VSMTGFRLASEQTTSIFTFGNEIDRVLGAAVHLRMPLLASESPDFRDRHPMDAEIGQPRS
jgi:hypothetical protein